MGIFKSVSACLSLGLAAIVFFSGCKAQVQDLQREGKVSITLQEEGRTLLPNANLTVAKYKIRFEKSGSAPLDYELSAGAAGESYTLPAGVYTLTVDGVNAQALVVARGSVPVTVTTGALTEAEVILSLLPGNGTLNLEAKIEGLGISGAQLSALVEKSGEIGTFPLSFAPEGNLYKASASLSSGTYSLTFQLRDGNGTLLATGVEWPFVVAGATTYGGVSFYKSASGTVLASITMNAPTVTLENLADAQVPSISFNPAAGPYVKNSSLTISLAGETGSVIRYTLDGSVPTETSTTYVSPLPAPTATVGTVTVKARAWVSGKNSSQVAEKSYEVINNDYVVPDTLGALYTPAGTTFRIWSPDSTDVSVTVNGATHALTKRADFNGYTEVYEKVVAGDLKGKAYNFKVAGKSVRDPYGKMVEPGTNNNIIMDMTASTTAPEGGWADRPALANREDAVVYEVHVRDFTIDSSWNGPADKKGKFLGMVHPGTTTAGGKPTGLDHLKELGVTHVQILPTYDFATAQYNWGYDPMNYNVPEEQYSATPTNYENRVKEFRTMVNEFHKAGIRVVLDVVYNHTYGDEMFKDITSKYFTGTNDSGCGNAINTGNSMVSRMIRDSLEFWVQEYGVDGFRFDLIGIFHHTAVKEWGEYLNNTKFADRNLLMYGEPWNGYWSDPAENTKVRLGTTNRIASGHVGVFNGAYRESLKGNNDGTAKGYMFNSGVGKWWGAIPVGMRASPKYNTTVETLPDLWDSMFTLDPEQSVNYISAHDNFGLWDKIYISLAGNVVQADNKSGKEHQVLSFTPPSESSLVYGERVAKFGMGMIVTSQGIPFIHAGDEFLRTKTADQNIANASAWQYGNHGTHNTYNAPDSFNSIKWNRKDTYSAVNNYHRDLIALRKANSGLRLTTWNDVKSRMKTFVNFGTNTMGDHLTNDTSLPGNAFVSHLDNDGNPGNGYELVLVYNSGNNFNVNLPAGTWKKVFDINGTADVAVSSPAAVEGTAVTVFKKQ